MDLLAARWQMGLSLGFHIIFASIGIAMPFFMAVSHWKWLRTKKPVYLKITKAWSKGVAIFFATGAVSGTALSFELGLLWPTFMLHAGPIIGMPFSWEGTAFFLEAIALGLYLYGWDKLPPYIHWFCGIVVGIAGVLSGLFVICANGWMNSPTGFEWVDGQFTSIDPVAAMFNDAALLQGIHMTVAAFQATGFAVAGVHAWLALKYPKFEFHRHALRIALLFGIFASLIQPVIGDFSAKSVARRQPIKFAAMEALSETEKPAAYRLGPIEIPGLLSFMATGDFNAEVKGLNDFPKDELPPVGVVRTSFLLMIFIGVLLALISLVCLWTIWKKKKLSDPLLRVLGYCTPLGFIAMEAGWIVTEVGRQPWIIYQIMKTSEALSPMPGLVIPFILFFALYVFLSVLVSWLILRQIRALHA